MIGCLTMMTASQSHSSQLCLFPRVLCRVTLATRLSAIQGWPVVSLVRHRTSITGHWADGPSVCDDGRVPKTSTWVLLITDNMDAGYGVSVNIATREISSQPMRALRDFEYVHGAHSQSTHCVRTRPMPTSIELQMYKLSSQANSSSLLRSETGLMTTKFPLESYHQNPNNYYLQE